MSKKRSLKEMQRAYAHHDRGIHDADSLFRGLLEDIGHVSRPVRKGDLLDGMLPLLLKRLMVIWDISGIDVAEAAWHKYPGACPYCLSKRNCSCITMKVKPEIRNAEVEKFRAQRSRMPQSLEDFQKMFKRIFGKINDDLPIENSWLHFVEECGELSEELRCGNSQGAIEETGDVFAWLIAMANKLGIDLEGAIEE